MYGRAFPVGNVLFFFDCGSGLFCLPSGEGPLAFFAVEALQNGRIEAPGQTLDDLIRIDRSVDDFFLFVQVHLLFRSTAWLMGMIQLAKPQVWNRRGRPCFAPEPVSQFFLRGIQKYAPQPPLPPRTHPFGRVHGQAGRVLKKRSERNKASIRFIFIATGVGARGAGNFHFPPQFYSRA